LIVIGPNRFSFARIEYWVVRKPTVVKLGNVPGGLADCQAGALFRSWQGFGWHCKPVLVFVPDSKYRSRGTDFTVECARKYGKPYYIVHYLDGAAITGLKKVVS
jgi:hypothetical protein